MAFPLAAVAAGGTLAVSAGRNFFGGRGDRRRINEGVSRLEGLRPRIRAAGREAGDAARTAVQRFQNFDAMQGFDEELAARTRLPLQQVADNAIASGTFRSGRRLESQQRVIGQEAANLLTARQRLQLSAFGGLAGAAQAQAGIDLDFLGAESELESGLIDFFQSRQNRRDDELANAFRLFATVNRPGG